MATPTVISVENVSKQYRLGVIGTSTIRDDLQRWWEGVRGRRVMGVDSADEIWALRGVSFTVQQGEVLGIIGRNGAGKSTLLKILSRVTAPTGGRVRVRDRIASLLEVGTGFHPELTGRDNIFLNGTILGMTKTEIRRKFDEILAFSEIGKFIDTPVKRYSSGMYVRLAFAVAAHLDPEILIVDEVLAVGDVSFQQKCLGKMHEVASQGRTVLFVSHNLGAIRRLCTRGVLLVGGQVALVGDVGAVTGAYLEKAVVEKRVLAFPDRPDKPGSILGLKLVSPGRGLEEPLDVYDPLEIHMEYALHHATAGVNVGLSLSRDGEVLFSSFDIDEEPELFGARAAGRYTARLALPRGLFKAGRYTVEVDMGRSGAGVMAESPEPLCFILHETSTDMTHKAYAQNRPGELILPLKWNTMPAGPG